jgi:hypothetical protein
MNTNYTNQNVTNLCATFSFNEFMMASIDFIFLITNLPDKDTVK